MSADGIRLVAIKDRPMCPPEAGKSRQVLAYTDMLMQARHLWKIAGSARGTAIRANRIYRWRTGLIECWR